MERKNFKGKELKKLIDDVNFLPSRGYVITTVNVESDEGDLIVNSDAISEIQYIVASGNFAQYAPGDRIMINLDAMTVKIRDKIDETKTEDKIQLMPFIWDGAMLSVMSENKILGKFQD